MRKREAEIKGGRGVEERVEGASQVGEEEWVSCPGAG